VTDARTVEVPGGGAAPASTPAADSNGSEPLTYDGAIARKAELGRQPGFVDRWINGELTARKQVDEINAALHAGAPDPNVILRAALIDPKRTTLKPNHIEDFVNGVPVTQAVHDECVSLKNSLMRDRVFLAKYFDGDVESIRKIETIGLVLAAPIKV
jgi:hypothetical protein